MEIFLKIQLDEIKIFTITESQTAYFLCLNFDTKRYMGCSNENSRITGLNLKEKNLVNAGVYLFTKKFFDNSNYKSLQNVF